ncbi:hypothetical protein [Streptomyces sp. NPDC005955]|uniref:hypothetical protein n=1 Tax=Streptomyces sp. NPDC005955 TaxID=3364738 RepID=UPI0036C766AF
MSRETDSSSSGPHGRGGAAYPSGTPAYGTPAGAAPGVGPDERQSADASAEDRKTETTLTTRVRINIPGSRPIPPVVMRTPVAESDAGPGRDADTGATHPPAVPGQAAAPAGPAAQAPRPPGQGADGDPEKPSAWFAPRKSGPARGGPSGTPANGTPMHPGSPAAPAPADHGHGHGQVPGGGTLGGLPVGGPQDTHGDLPYFTPGVPQGPEATGEMPRVGAPRMSDDTAVLTPQQHAPAPPGGPLAPGGPIGAVPAGPGDNVSGHTLTSGIPVVQPAVNHPVPGGEVPGAGPVAQPPAPAPVVPPPAADKPAGPTAPAGPSGSAASSKPAKKKGRSKLVLLAVLVVLAGSGTYGAGLLLNHSDVPKGTTVLGVDIGGGTRDEAVKKLDAALGKRITQPLQLSVDGKTVPLRPDQAGLTFDTDATVASAAGSDYHPVSVVTSLFGEERVVSPSMPVDTEKLQVQLERAVGGGSGAGDGGIRFEGGKAVASYGKPGKGVDVKGSLLAIEEAFRVQVETGKSAPVKLAATDREPSISKAEVDRMMKEFAEPAMSGLVTITAGPNASIPFGPDKSLPQIIGVKAVNGKLVDTYDLAALQSLYGSTFDGVLVTRGTGEKTAVTPQDVASALKQALKGKTQAERTVAIPLDAS